MTAAEPTLCVTEQCSRPRRSRGLCHPCYTRFLTRQHAYGRFESRYVPADPARAHLEALCAAGVGSRRICELAGVSRVAVRAILVGRPHRGSGPSKNILRTTADAILAVPLPAALVDLAAPGAHVDSTGARRRLQALVANGWSVDAMTEHTTIGKSQLYRIIVAENDITAARARAVAALFDRLQLIPGTSVKAQQRGRRNRWALPFEWDEEALDDPAAKPHRGARWTRSSSRRERRESVADLTARGLSAPAIADRLRTTSRTVERDRKVAS